MQMILFCNGCNTKNDIKLLNPDFEACLMQPPTCYFYFTIWNLIIVVHKLQTSATIRSLLWRPAFWLAFSTDGALLTDASVNVAVVVQFHETSY